jgi:hypothetical protein
VVRSLRAIGTLVLLHDFMLVGRVVAQDSFVFVLVHLGLLMLFLDRIFGNSGR